VPGTNTLAYFAHLKATMKKSFISFANLNVMLNPLNIILELLFLIFLFVPRVSSIDPERKTEIARDKNLL